MLRAGGIRARNSAKPQSPKPICSYAFLRGLFPWAGPLGHATRVGAHGAAAAGHPRDCRAGGLLGCLSASDAPTASPGACHLPSIRFQPIRRRRPPIFIAKFRPVPRGCAGIGLPSRRMSPGEPRQPFNSQFVNCWPAAGARRPRRPVWETRGPSWPGAGGWGGGGAWRGSSLHTNRAGDTGSGPHDDCRSPKGDAVCGASIRRIR